MPRKPLNMPGAPFALAAILATTIACAAAPNAAEPGEPLRVVSAKSCAAPPHIILTFNRAVDPTSATNVVNYLVSGADVHQATVPGRGRVVRLLTSPLEDNRSYAVRLGPIADRAVPPGVVSEGFVVQTTPLKMQELFRRDFESDTVDNPPKNVTVKTEGTKDTYVLTTVRNIFAGQGKALGCSITGSARLILGSVPLDARYRYSVSADVFAEAENQTVAVQFRRDGYPFDKYGAHRIRVKGSAARKLAFVFTPTRSDPKALVCFVINGDGDVVMDNLRVARILE